MKKIILRPERLRRVPSQFSWLDQRLFRHPGTAACSSDTLALYLFLVTVADAQGLSFYSDATLSRILHWDGLRLATARCQLVDADLLAYRQPFYQVLSLDPLDPPSQRLGQAASVGEILRRAMTKGGTP